MCDFLDLCGKDLADNREFWRRKVLIFSKVYEDFKVENCIDGERYNSIIVTRKACCNEEIATLILGIDSECFESTGQINVRLNNLPRPVNDDKMSVIVTIKYAGENIKVVGMNDFVITKYGIKKVIISEEVIQGAEKQLNEILLEYRRKKS